MGGCGQMGGGGELTAVTEGGGMVSAAQDHQQTAERDSLFSQCSRQGRDGDCLLKLAS